MKIGDKVRFTDKAIFECREIFGREAHLQAKDRDVMHTVKDISFDKTGKPLVVTLENNMLCAACHLVLY